MRYFEDVRFVLAGYEDACRSRFAQSWPNIYAIQFCSGGGMYFARDPQPPVKMDGPFLFWVTPDQSYRYGPRDDRGWEHHFITMVGPRAERWFREGISLLNDRDFLPVRSVEPFRTLFRNLIDLVKLRDPARQAECVVLVEEILARIDRERQEPATAREARMREIARQMRMNPRFDFDLAAAAREIGIGYHTAREAFKEVIGRSPHAYLQDCILAAVAERLANPDCRIKELAEEFGCGSPRHLGRLFLQTYGIAPREYARGVRAQGK